MGEVPGLSWYRVIDTSLPSPSDIASIEQHWSQNNRTPLHSAPSKTPTTVSSPARWPAYLLFLLKSPYSRTDLVNSSDQMVGDPKLHAAMYSESAVIACRNHAAGGLLLVSPTLAAIRPNSPCTL